MINPDSTPACGILYVDDEEKALKYFRLAFSSKYRIFTAASGAEGMEILRREPGRIGIVLSDQRMPGMLGAEFLGMVREEFPFVVRILTTAHSDLESAIQAVNTGHIYQYVVKPWEITDLGMVLQRAADYYHVLSERNELLSLKMTTLQRVICSDRVKWLLLSSRHLEGAAQSAFRGALVALVKALPENLQPAATGPGAFSKRHFEIAGLIGDEYRNASCCLDSMAAFQAEAATAVDDAAMKKALERFLSALIGAFELEREDVAFAIDDASNAQLRLPSFAPRKLSSALFGLLVERETPEVSVRLLEALVALAQVKGTLEVHETGSASFVFSPRAESTPDEVIDALYEKFSASDISRL